MWIKVAGLAAESGDYKKAISIYEKVSKSSLENSALRWSVKGYLFKSILCHFVLASKSHRLEGVSSKLEQYVDMCPDMDNSREKGLIEDIIQDFNEGDSDKFAEHVFTFDEICKLDAWTSTVLLKIKRNLEAGNPDDNGVGV
jgi:alpha-soluble NSF attachment protein